MVGKGRANYLTHIFDDEGWPSLRRRRSSVMKESKK